jgi:endonuclease YncB( thermonuclease family)
MSKIVFFDCLSEKQWNWREQSHSLFENLKHNRVNIDIIQPGERSTYEVCLGYVYKDNESLMGVDILQNEVSV